jgi:ABC-type lipoprotein release transport system permease subunit
VGKRIRYVSNQPDWFQVVGLTRDTKHYGLDQEMKPSVFVPFRVLGSNGMYIVVRSAGDPDTLTSSVREAVRQADPGLPIFDLRTMTSRLNRSLWTRRVYSWLFGTFAGMAILLAATGIYGVISFAVSQRTREIGIRMALGARPQQVMAAVLGPGMALVGAGIVVGVAASVFTSRFLSSLLFGVSPSAIITYLIVIGTVALVGALANLIPARRAAEVDPIRALRFD